jgi:hypothetical protein
MGIRPVITYGAPIWFTGRRQEGLIKELETAQNEGVRWCLGAFRTSNVEAMRHIVSIPPIRYVLGQLRENCSTRLRAVGPNHGLVTRLAKRSRLRRRKATTLANLEALSADVTEWIDPAHEAAGDVPAGLCCPLLDEIDTRVCHGFPKAPRLLCHVWDSALFLPIRSSPLWRFRTYRMLRSCHCHQRHSTQQLRTAKHRSEDCLLERFHLQLSLHHA